MSESVTTDKRREAFEREFPNAPGYRFADGFYHMPEKPTYKKSELVQHQMYLHAWRWWNKALDSVVVELPKAEEFDGYYNSGIGYHKCDVIEAIESAGVRVKS